MTITINTSDNWITVRMTRTGTVVGDFASREAAERFVRARGYINPIVVVI